MLDAVPAIPVNPTAPEMSAMMRNVTAQLSIVYLHFHEPCFHGKGNQMSEMVQPSQELRMSLG